MSEELSKKLNYQFQQPKLLKTALTHRSKGGDHNERLEFLGDAVVNFVIAEALYHQFPEATEGELSRWRASLVNRDTLGDLAKQFDLGHYLFLGVGEQKSGGSERHSILSCTMEAVIGAVYLDGGFTTVQECIVEWYGPLLYSLSSAASHKDPKTLLQEYLQSHRMSLPTYKIAETEGEAHQQIFTVACHVNEMETIAIGKGTSRRRAEQDSAQHMLELLKK
ncbi:MAG: ribonuclease III [Gammaproteobacteria bacterium RIFCSPHIGHO2_12_FULL_42_13]|nr:MAG: ribonuclease III [Gammaproteobacteria bacterium RIFCSPHIGHO2_12_FULL_42_13]